MKERGQPCPRVFLSFGLVRADKAVRAPLARLHELALYLSLPPVKLGLGTVGIGLVVIGDVDGPQDRVIHLFREQVKLGVAVAEQHVVAALAAEIVPGTLRVGRDPVSVPGTVS